MPPVKNGNLMRLDLVEVAAGAGGDQARRAERLVRRAHHLAERGRDRRVVEVLEHDHGRARQLGELLDLLVHAAVGVAAARRGVAAERRRAGEADHRRQLGKAAPGSGRPCSRGCAAARRTAR